MSRIGRLPIPVPSGVDVTIDGRHGDRQGPQGSAQRTPSRRRSRSRSEDGTLLVTPPGRRAQHSRALHGLTRTLVANMVTASPTGYEKKLEIVGVGYRVAARARTSSSRSATATRSRSSPRTGITFAVEAPDPLQRVGHRQAAGRRGRREHPQAAQARPVQGQGRALRRARTSAARSERRVSRMAIGIKRSGGRPARARTPPASAATCGCARGRRHARRVRASSSPAPRGTWSAQVVDDTRGHTLASASTMEVDLRGARRRQDGQGPSASASCSPSGPRPPASRPWCSTVVATATTAGSRRSPTAPARAGWPCDRCSDAHWPRGPARERNV